MKNRKSADIRDFDFRNSSDNREIDDWLTIMRSKITVDRKLPIADLDKISELFKIILEDREYRIPRDRGKKKSSLTSVKQLHCWYVIRTTLEGKATMEAIEITAAKFCIGIETIKKHYYDQRKIINKLIESEGLEAVSNGFRHHLSIMNKSDD